tara:strand:+ start:970 stop:1374 length:405 start_codon:yes stop_codon:yes gene_type:complete
MKEENLSDQLILGEEPGVVLIRFVCALLCLFLVKNKSFISKNKVIKMILAFAMGYAATIVGVLITFFLKNTDNTHNKFIKKYIYLNTESQKAQGFAGLGVMLTTAGVFGVFLTPQSIWAILIGVVTIIYSQSID